MQVGDQVEYIGKQFDCYRDLELTVWQLDHKKVACTYADKGRPSNRELGVQKDIAITTWLDPEDLEIDTIDDGDCPF